MTRASVQSTKESNRICARAAIPSVTKTRGISRAAWVVIGASLLFAIVYIYVDLNKLCALRIGSNTGEYLQGAVRFLQDGSTFNYVDWKPTLATHDQWMFLFLAPFAAVWPHPEMVIIVQVLVLAAAAPVLYALVRAWGGARETAVLVAIIYLLSPSVQGFANADFVPPDFVPLLGAGMLLALARGSIVGVLVCAQLLCGTKEDTALFLAWFGIVYAVVRDRRLGVAVAALALLNVVVYYGVGHHFTFSTVHPQYGLSDPAWPKQLAFTAEILAPFAFAPLALRWRILFVAPILAELFFAHWAYPLYQAGSYYTIVLITAVTLAAAHVLATRPTWARVALGFAIVMALFFNTTVLHFGRHLYSCDPLYPVARAWSFTHTRVDFPCEDQGAWTVAAGNTDARLFGCGRNRTLKYARAAWANASLSSEAPWTKGPNATVDPPDIHRN